MTTVKPTTTPFYRLDAATGWRQSANSSGILQDSATACLRLGKPGDFPIAVNEPFGSFAGMTLPRGVSVANDGRVLLADPGGNRILYYDNLPCDRETIDSNIPYPFRLLWQPTSVHQTDNAMAHEIFKTSAAIGAYQILHPQDVLFAPSGEIVVADTGHKRVLIYSWPDFRLRHILNFSDGAPAALAYDSRHRLYVADSGNGKIWRITRLWQIDSTFYGGDDQLSSPVALAIDSDDNVFVLDTQMQIVVLQQNGDTYELDPLGTEIFSHSFSVPPLRLYDNLLGYPQLQKHHCEVLNLNDVSVDSQGYLSGTSLPLLARPRSIRLPRSGVYFSEQLDSEISSSQWHRIVLEGEVPLTGRILVQTHTGDRHLDETEVADLEWSEPTMLSADQLNDRLEVLIQSGRGRYLHLRIELLGDGHSTPSIANIQVYGPRSSSVHYLPPPFHQDPESVFFLDRLLSYFDTSQQEIRFMMSDFTRYLDPQGVPAGAFLDWLGSWFDWHFLAQWPTDLRREMIRRSIEFFKQRGTLKGLKLMLQWHTGLQGDQPQIIEHFRLRNYTALQVRKPVESRTAPVHDLFVAEKPLTPPADEITHWFTVVLPVSVVPDEKAHQLITGLIEAQKPAHTAFQLCLFSPGLRIGKQSSIGIDTWLGHYPKEPLGTLILGQSSGLTAATSPGHKIGRKILK